MRARNLIFLHSIFIIFATFPIGILSASSIASLTLKHAGGGADSAHRVRIWLVFLQFSSKLLKYSFFESSLVSAFTKIFFGKLRMIEIKAIGGAERGHPFFSCCILDQKICSQKLTIRRKRRQFVRSFTEEIRKF